MLARRSRGFLLLLAHGGRRQSSRPGPRFLGSGRGRFADAGHCRSRTGTRRQSVDHGRLHYGWQQQTIGTGWFGTGSTATAAVVRGFFYATAQTTCRAVTVDRSWCLFRDSRSFAVYPPGRSLQLL